MSNDLKSPTLPSFITEEWLKDKICTKHGIQSDSIKLTVEGKDSLSGGYLSYITKLRLRWSDNVPELPPSVIVKAVTMDKIALEMERTIGKKQATKSVETFEKNLRNLHNNECYVYDTFLKNVDSTVPYPTIYGTQRLTTGQPNGLLVLSDLSEVAGCVPVQDGFTLTQTKKLIETVANLQAFSMQSDQWRSQLYPINREGWLEVGNSVAMMFETVKGKYPEIYNGIDVCDLTPFNDVDQYMKYCFEGPFEHSVFVHGDLWANNIMISKNNDKFNDEIEGLIDWQICHIGQPAEDLARVIVLHLNPKERRLNEWKLLDYYYERLTQKLGCTPSFTIDYVKQCYKNSMGFAVAVALLLHGIRSDMMTEKENKTLGERIAALIKDAIGGYY